MSNDPHLQSIPAIDYEAHPAFACQGVEPEVDVWNVKKILERIDRDYERIARDTNLSRNSIEIEFRDVIRPGFEQLIRFVTEDKRLEAHFRHYAENAIEQAAGFLLEGLLSGMRRPGRVLREAEGSACLRSVLNQGFCKVGIDESLADQVWKSTWWERSLLRRRAKAFPSGHCVLALGAYSPGAQAIRKALYDKGVIDAVSAYIGQEMGFLYAALDYSHEKQNWYKDCYRDVGLSTAKTVYMHFDADHDVMKAMLYLKDVGPKNGPFRYVRASHRWQRSTAQCALDKGFDVQQTKMFAMENDGLDYKLGYYRPRYKLPEYRKGLSMLPSNLRGSTHFGDDIVDGSPLSVSLLQQEEVFVGPAGTFVVFDGSKGIHRGSQVDEGERWAVQIGMRVVKGTAGGRLPPPIRAMVGRLRYQLRRAQGLLQTWGVN